MRAMFISKWSLSTSSPHSEQSRTSSITPLHLRKGKPSIVILSHSRACSVSHWLPYQLCAIFPSRHQMNLDLQRLGHLLQLWQGGQDGWRGHVEIHHGNLPTSVSRKHVPPPFHRWWIQTGSPSPVADNEWVLSVQYPKCHFPDFAFQRLKADPAIRIDTLPLCQFHFCLAKRTNTFSFPFAIDSVTLNCVFVFDHKICLSVKWLLVGPWSRAHVPKLYLILFTFLPK